MEKVSPHFVDNLQKKVISTVHAHQMIAKNDRILLAVSGGKDSMVMLETFIEKRRKIPFDFQLFVAHITDKKKNYITDTQLIEDYCKENNIEYIEREIEIEENKNGKHKDKSFCFLCSWTRRKALFLITKEYNINKLVFAHNLDDAIETLLMNMVYHGSISSLPFKVTMFEGRVELIRPLLAIENKDLETYAQLRGFPNEMKRCKYVDITKRTDMRNIIDTLNKMNPLARKNIFRSMSKQFPEYLPLVVRK